MPRPTKHILGQVSDIDLRLLKVFRTVVECGGFSQAEIELNVTSSAISISMADLEKRLGLRLCQRGRAGFSLTEEGAKVYEATLQLLTSLESFRAEIHGIHDKLTGELTIGLTDNLVTMQRMQVTHAIRALKLEGSEVRIRMRMAPPNEIERAVLDGVANVGVIPVVQVLKGLEYQNLYYDDFCLYCSNEHPLFGCDDKGITQADLAMCDMIMPAFAQTADVMSLYQGLSSTASSTDREGIAFLILTGLYIGFLPTHFAEQWVKQGRMRAIQPETMRHQVQYAAVTRKGVRPNLVLETFMQKLIEHADD